VRRLYPLIACLLLSMWLPATMHCGFESLGTMVDFGGNLCDDKGSCDHDSCDLLEGGGYSSSIDVVDVAPVLLVTALPWCDPASRACAALCAIAEPERPPIDFTRRPLPGWQFDHRAAPLPGAPQIRAT
jgi:hypothetical protein